MGPILESWNGMLTVTEASPRDHGGARAETIGLTTSLGQTRSESKPASASCLRC